MRHQSLFRVIWIFPLTPALSPEPGGRENEEEKFGSID